MEYLTKSDIRPTSQAAIYSASVEERATVGWNFVIGDRTARKLDADPAEGTAGFDASSPIRVAVCHCDRCLVFWAIVKKEVLCVAVDGRQGRALFSESSRNARWEKRRSRGIGYQVYLRISTVAMVPDFF